MLWRKIKWGKQIHGEDVFIVKNGGVGMNITLGENIPDRVSKCSGSLAIACWEGW